MQRFLKVLLGTATLFILAIASPAQSSIPEKTMLQVVQAEDERRCDSALLSLFKDQNPSVRRRAALAAGRIGDSHAIPALAELLAKDSDQSVRSMAAFALGEIESWEAAAPLLSLLRTDMAASSVRGRSIEALGKISAALEAETEKQKAEINTAISEALKLETERSTQDEQTILLALTAAMRGRAVAAAPTVVQLLDHSNARIRADAENTLARLRLKDGGSKLLTLLATDKDAIVRANAARALGAAENKEAVDALLDRALNDADVRVRVSSIRALAPLKDQKVVGPLLNRAEVLSKSDANYSQPGANEILEIATTLGRVLQGTENQEAISWLRKARKGFGNSAPELEIAAARISPQTYLQDLGSDQVVVRTYLLNWKAGASVAQGLRELASLPDSTKDKGRLVSQGEATLNAMLDYRKSALNVNVFAKTHSEYAVPDMLRALAAFKPNNLAPLLRNYLEAPDVIVRSTAADLLGELPPNEENASALSRALPRAMKDELNDAALSILDSLGKQKTSAANQTIKTALDSSDHLIRRRAVALLKTNGAGDFSSRIGTVQTRNKQSDYKRALARIGKSTRATVTTPRGSFVIEFLPEDAPLTVDNFVRLAQKGYFNGQTIPRVVSNFVVQAGDPRGDQNGGPGYSIRCEINEVPYDRAAVGMALSGKDTGGSQWFVTHSPQPHLDGGYTVFGRVVSGMDTVDNIIRGDQIRTITIAEKRLSRDETSQASKK
jgi:cyclophilin family peptidyl-prolyl cis-trans isomerase/HEAT repeat protein